MSSESTWRSPQKIYDVNHSAVEEILKHPVEVQEKIDGSFFAFGVFDGQLRFRSKGQDIKPDDPEPLFEKGVTAIAAIQDTLTPGYMYRGEYLQKPRHNGLAYNRIPVNHVILFDILIGPEKYMTSDASKAEADRIGLEHVPVLGMGEHTVDTLHQFLDRESILGGQIIEGVVLKPCRHDLFGGDGKRLMAKVVREDFKEVQRKFWTRDNEKAGDVIERISQSIRSEARWDKAVMHLAERGELARQPQDIPALMAEVLQDTRDELEEEILKQLWQHAWPKIRRNITRGLPEYYKQKHLGYVIHRKPVEDEEAVGV
jgi:hypothetical protein